MPGTPVVILTQEADDNARLAELLSARGIPTHSYPCIATRLLPFDDTALPSGRSLADYRIVAFSSKRGVAGIAGAGEHLRKLAPVIACVGTATAEAAGQMLGLQASIVPDNQTGEGLARAILREFATPVPVLLIRGNRTSGTFQRILQKSGWPVDEVVVYENTSPSPEPLGLLGDCIAAFASPSAAECFFSANPELARTCRCVAIGEATAQRLEEIGLTDVALARQSSMQALADRIIELCGEEIRT
jgi:uroporphyrinogen-III synthase